jgi:hypothetical protein
MEHKEFRMTENNHAPSPESLQGLLETIAPGSTFVAIHPLEGDFSNSTLLVEGKGADGLPFQVVARRYAIFGGYDPERCGLPGNACG